MKQVFWVQTFIGIMAKFLTVIALDLAKITSLVSALILIVFLFFACFYLDSIKFNGHRGACLLAFVPTITAAFLFPIFVSFFKDFKLVLRRSGILKPGLGFFGTEILY